MNELTVHPEGEKRKGVLEPVTEAVAVDTFGGRLSGRFFGTVGRFTLEPVEGLRWNAWKESQEYPDGVG